MLPSHTFLTYKEENKSYWFEHSWGSYKGLHEYENEKALLQDMKKIFLKEHHYEEEITELYLYQYEKPKDHITCDEFYDYIETQKQIEV